ncbi:class F sortase [Kutzneria buriramensis]|uniref:Sortase family protein n=1 Tax=Kutzneria buriramensis TaxID=1045776 RepID=A0A3E0IAN3_9PSEU|nr:class F sortase [Kutzneria buriramensis]REH55737.1 sortase family protein [Kutzneria buriramensis]
MKKALTGLLLALALATAACGGQPAPEPSPAAAATTHATTTTTDAPKPPSLAASTPVSVDIPKIGAHSSLVPLGLNADQTIEVPPVSTPMQAGWYKEGPTPGEIGPAVILGHVDGNKQAGIFFRLHELAAGDKISVARQDKTTATFTVQKVELAPKANFPTDAVYGNTSTADLRVITCGGAFDSEAHSYVDNVIVFATLDKA